MFSVPANQLLAPLTNVVLPILSRQRNEGGDFYPLLWKAQIAISGALTFVFMLAASLAEPLIRTVLGPAWHESATLLSILSIGGAVQILTYMAYWAFLASGRARDLLFYSLVTKPLQAVCVIVGSVGGVTGVAWGYSVGILMSWFISLAWLKRCDSMPVRDFLHSGIHVLLSGLIAGSAGWVLVNLLDTRAPTIVLFIGGFALSASIYVVLIAVSGSMRKFVVSLFSPGLARLKAAIVSY